MELFLIPQFSLFENQFLQQSLLLEVDAYYLGVYSRMPPNIFHLSFIPQKERSLFIFKINFNFKSSRNRHG